MTTETTQTTSAPVTLTGPEKGNKLAKPRKAAKKPPA
jgi:hypothetical protein